MFRFAQHDSVTYVTSSKLSYRSGLLRHLVLITRRSR